MEHPGTDVFDSGPTRQEPILALLGEKGDPTLDVLMVLAQF